jgi:hypothetical protein
MPGVRGPELTRFETPGPEVGNGDVGLAGHAADRVGDESCVLAHAGKPPQHFGNK